MKTQTLLFSLLFFSVSFSQNLYDKISENAVAVLGINGGEVLQKVSLEELNSTPVYEMLMKRYYGWWRSIIDQ